MSAFSGTEVVTDAQLAPGEPVEEELVEALPERDDHVKTGNADGNFDALFAAYNPGHGHTGAAGDGPQIKTDGIANGGIWKAEYIDDDACTSGKLATGGVNNNALASGAVREQEMDGDATTGMAHTVGIDSGVQTYDPFTGANQTWTCPVSAAYPMVVANPGGYAWVVYDTPANGGAITFGLAVDPTGVFSTTAYRVQCDLV